MRFPPDFHIPAVRDVRIPGGAAVRRTMAKRVTFIEAKAAEREAAGAPTGYLVDELAAIAVFMADDPEWPARLEHERKHIAERAAIIAEEGVS